jgi:hypothetical protein
MKKEPILIFLLLLGFGLTIGNWWFDWDLHNYFQRFINGEKASKEFCFWLPYYIGCVRYEYWSLAFDILFGLSIFAAFLIAISAYFLGKLKE